MALKPKSQRICLLVAHTFHHSSAIVSTYWSKARRISVAVEDLIIDFDRLSTLIPGLLSNLSVLQIIFHTPSDDSPHRRERGYA